MGTSKMTWVDHKNWKEEWDSIDEMKSGSQASAKKVCNKNSDQIGFMKILNRQGIEERRGRFFREASVYAQANHSNIPKILQTNAHQHSDKNYDLFLVTEFIEGRTLSELPKEPLDFKKAAQIVHSLLDTIEYCHNSLECVHRDIKPDNIILRENDYNRPILLDFGISYKKEAEPTIATELNQGLGNRFLFLPELSPDSPSKQDVRSDLAFLGGILYYLLTSSNPTILWDHEGKMPHQRSTFRELSKNYDSRLYQSLCHFFDRIFPTEISKRYASVKEMKTVLEKLMELNENPDVDNTLKLEDILAQIDHSANQQLARYRKLYNQAMSIIRGERAQFVHGINRHLGDEVYQIYYQGYENFDTGLKEDIGFNHFSTLEKRFTIHFHITIEGDEIVIRADGASIYRTDVNTPEYTEEFKSDIYQRFLNGLKNLEKIA